MQTDQPWGSSKLYSPLTKQDLEEDAKDPHKWDDRPPCKICYQKHRPILCPYFMCYPKGAPLNPGYAIICSCGNQFDEERWVCTSCPGSSAIVTDKHCIMCNVFNKHASYECPVHKELAAKYKQQRDETNQRAATTLRKYYVLKP